MEATSLPTRGSIPEPLLTLRAWIVGPENADIVEDSGGRSGIHSSSPEGLERFASLSHCLKCDKAWASES